MSVSVAAFDLCGVNRLKASNASAVLQCRLKPRNIKEQSSDDGTDRVGRRTLRINSCLIVPYLCSVDTREWVGYLERVKNIKIFQAATALLAMPA